ncbi:transposase [Streptomyces sirii]|uniref:transposase n=1 Tax=Streptomyces sirii TaxID=3127701 RepID=UPI003D35BAC6
MAAPLQPPDAMSAGKIKNESSIVEGKTSLVLSEGLDLSGLVSLKIGRGKMTHAERKFIGGEVQLGGNVALDVGPTKAMITDVHLNIETGDVKAKINGKLLVLGSFDNGSMHLHKEAGSKILYVGIGGGSENYIDLSATAAAELNRILDDDDDWIEEGDELLTGELKVGVQVDASLATDFKVAYDALISAAINADIALGLKGDLVQHLPVLGCMAGGSFDAKLGKGHQGEPRYGEASTVCDAGSPIAQVAQDRDNREGVLTTWDAHEKGATRSDEREQLQRMRKLNHKLRMERDALKKSLMLWVQEAAKRQ